MFLNILITRVNQTAARQLVTKCSNPYDIIWMQPTLQKEQQNIALDKRGLQIFQIHSNPSSVITGIYTGIHCL